MTNEHKKRRKKDKNDLKNLILICGLCIIVLITATYAWFTGLQKVSVEPFEIEISTADSMEVSINGKLWTDNLVLTETGITSNVENDYGDSINQKAYFGNKNNWPSGDKEENKGLYPLSTIGLMDKDAGRVIFYGKTSLTTSPGGYRLLSSRIDNYQYASDSTYTQRFTGYVAFDLFVKNFSGTKYLTGPESDSSFEEAIYLTTDSEVKIGESGVESTGIQNSVRVAFAQVGRISAYNTDDTKITAITCKDSTDATHPINNTTGLCRKAQIWEPNDQEHASAALAWYRKSCLKRVSGGNTQADYILPSAVTSDNDKCNQIKKVLNEGGDPDNLADYHYPTLETYAIAKEILYTNSTATTENIDIYDGKDYNSFTGNTISEKDYLKQDEEHRTQALVAVDSFTDSDKLLEGKKRPTFITLAPSSITKVRIYVYIEGQDVDNFDYAQVGKKVSVKFGLTKQRFKTDDIDGISDELKDNLPSNIK